MLSTLQQKPLSILLFEQCMPAAYSHLHSKVEKIERIWRENRDRGKGEHLGFFRQRISFDIVLFDWQTLLLYYKNKE